MGKVLALIPARSGSKRVPGKNFKMLGGKPLVEWSITAALCSEGIHDVYVTTDIDDDSWLNYGCQYIPRPAELCQDDTPDLPVIRHALNAIGQEYDLVVYLRPTTPFRATYHIEQAVKLMRDIPTATGLRSVELMAESAFKCYTMAGTRLHPIKYFGKIVTDAPNHLVEPTYKPNGYVDIIRPEIIDSGASESVWGDFVIGYLTPHTIEIDTPDDWDYAQWYAQRQVEQIISFGKETRNKGAES